jgi:hypothetical protein
VTARDLGDLRYAVVNRRDVVQRAGRTREPEPTIVASGPPLATELRSVQLPRPQGPTTSTATGNKRPATTLPSSTPPLPATPTTRP